LEGLYIFTPGLSRGSGAGGRPEGEGEVSDGSWLLVFLEAFIILIARWKEFFIRRKVEGFGVVIELAGETRGATDEFSGTDAAVEDVNSHPKP
jgi:hypothetical protein